MCNNPEKKMFNLEIERLNNRIEELEARIQELESSKKPKQVAALLRPPFLYKTA